MKKRLGDFLLALVLLVSVSACGPKALSWQEQYDLGVRYLSEGDYEEAIIAFTAAIEIDPRQAPAYVGRGDAYVLSGETEDNLSAAKADYEKAIELDNAIVDAYLGLADVYIRQGEYDRALEVLKRGLDATEDNTAIADKLSQLEKKQEDTLWQADRFVNHENIEFIRFNDLNAETQAFLNEILARLDDKDFIQEKLTTEYRDLFGRKLVSQTLRTMKDGYKIQLTNVSYGEDADKQGGGLEVRPENGTAYNYVFVENQHQHYSIGTCKNWNWNGSYETIIISSNGITSYSGNCIDGRLDGAIHVTTPSGLGWYDYYEDGRETSKRVMEDGTERPKLLNYGDNEVHLYWGVMDFEYYQSGCLW